MSTLSIPLLPTAPPRPSPPLPAQRSPIRLGIAWLATMGFGREANKLGFLSLSVSVLAYWWPAYRGGGRGAGRLGWLRGKMEGEGKPSPTARVSASLQVGDAPRVERADRTPRRAAQRLADSPSPRDQDHGTWPSSSINSPASQSFVFIEPTK